jgi:hypothetical protein
MTRKTTLFGVALLATALLAVGCAKPPQQELDAAKAALSDAEAAQAQSYAGSELAAARDALNAAQAEIDAQNAKFALFRSYKSASTMLADASTKATAAKDAAVAGKAKAKQEAEAAVQTAKDAVAQAQAKLTELEGCRRRPKGFAEDLATLKGQVDALAASAAGLDSQLTSEDYLGAKSAAESLTSQAQTLVADLDAAKTKIRC